MLEVFVYLLNRRSLLPRSSLNSKLSRNMLAQSFHVMETKLTLKTANYNKKVRNDNSKIFYHFQLT